MEAPLSEFVTLVGLAIAAGVAVYRAAVEIVRGKVLALYTILAGLSVALLAVYADKIVIR